MSWAADPTTDAELLDALDTAFEDGRRLPGRLVRADAVAEHVDLTRGRVVDRLSQLAERGEIDTAMTVDPVIKTQVRGFRP